METARDADGPLMYTGMLNACGHPLRSVMVAVYWPGDRWVAVLPNCAGTVFHTVLYWPLPPVTVREADPSFLPKQLAACWLATCAAIACAGWVITMFRTVLHPAASLTVTVHVPAARPLMLALFTWGTVFQL